MQQADAKCGKQGACWVTMIVQGRVMGLRIADMRMCVDMLPAIVRMRMNVDPVAVQFPQDAQSKPCNHDADGQFEHGFYCARYGET